MTWINSFAVVVFACHEWCFPLFAVLTNFSFIKKNLFSFLMIVFAKLLAKRLYMIFLPCIPQELWNQINSSIWNVCRDCTRTRGTNFHLAAETSFKNIVVSLGVINALELIFIIVMLINYNYSDDQCNCFFCIISFDNTFKYFKEKR